MCTNVCKCASVMVTSQSFSVHCSVVHSVFLFVLYFSIVGCLFLAVSKLPMKTLSLRPSYTLTHIQSHVKRWCLSLSG